jgi:stromal membrane-associated protein
MEEWGNRRANDYWEANVPAHVTRPKEGDAVRVVERYIRDKYEFKRYCASSLPPKNSEAAPEVEEAPSTTAASTRRQSAAVAAPVKVSKPVEQPASLQPKVAPAAAPSLLDFDEPVVIPAVAQPTPAPAQPAASTNGDLFSFDAFQQAPAAPSQPAQQQQSQHQGFGDFSADPFNQVSFLTSIIDYICFMLFD